MSHLCRIVEKEEIQFWKRVKIRLFGEIPAFKVNACGKGEIEYFFSYCPKHKCYFIDYYQGYEEKLRCPKCVEENSYACKK